MAPDQVKCVTRRTLEITRKQCTVTAVDRHYTIAATALLWTISACPQRTRHHWTISTRPPTRHQTITALPSAHRHLSAQSLSNNRPSTGLGQVSNDRCMIVFLPVLGHRRRGSVAAPPTQSSDEDQTKTRRMIIRPWRFSHPDG